VTKSLSRVLVAEALDPLSTPQPVPYPHDLAAPAARACGHRVRPPGHFAPGDLSARLADELCHRRHLKGITRPTVEFIGHLRVLYVSRAGGVPGAGERKRGLSLDRSCASGFGDRTFSPKAGAPALLEQNAPGAYRAGVDQRVADLEAARRTLERAGEEEAESPYADMSGDQLRDLTEAAWAEAMPRLLERVTVAAGRGQLRQRVSVQVSPGAPPRI
jgi:hypothetical protein